MQPQPGAVRAGLPLDGSRGAVHAPMRGDTAADRTEGWCRGPRASARPPEPRNMPGYGMAVSTGRGFGETRERSSDWRQSPEVRFRTMWPGSRIATRGRSSVSGGELSSRLFSKRQILACFAVEKIPCGSGTFRRRMFRSSGTWYVAHRPRRRRRSFTGSG